MASRADSPGLVCPYCGADQGWPSWRALARMVWPQLRARMRHDPKSYDEGERGEIHDTSRHEGWEDRG